MRRIQMTGLSNAITYKKYPYGDYMIGDNGSIFSLHRGNFLKLFIGNKGYILTAVTEKLGKVTRSLHRVVAITFLGESGLPVNHKNKDKLDNTLENLEYITSSGNSYHKWASTGKRFVTKLKAENKYYIQIQTPDRGRVRKSVVCDSKDQAYEEAREMYNTLFGEYPW
jgi:hypothetical protein